MSKANDMNPKSVDPLDRKFKLEDLRGKGTRGKYFALASKGSNVVKIDPQIARMFPNEEAVNTALAAVIGIAQLPQLKTATRRVRKSIPA